MTSEFKGTIRPSHDQPGPRTGPSLLRIQESSRLGLPLLYLSGELDHKSAGELRSLIEQEVRAGASGLFLEMSELQYIDSGGLALLFDTLHKLEDTGGLGVVSPNAGVARLMELTGLVGRRGFRVFPDLASITSAVSGSPETPDSP
jgi:anti-anti-sigma factor